MSDLIINPNQQPQCLKGCAHFRVIDTISGGKYPKCMLNLMLTYIGPAKELIIDVAKCPEFITMEDYVKQFAPQQNTIEP